MTHNAQQLLDYLQRYGWNAAREIAGYLCITESDFSLACTEIDEDTPYYVSTGNRRDSYGHEVVWLAKKEDEV